MIHRLNINKKLYKFMTSLDMESDHVDELCDIGELNLLYLSYNQGNSIMNILLCKTIGNELQYD